MLLLAVVLPLALPAQSWAKVFLTTDEALALAFGSAKIERKTFYLENTEVARARELAGVTVPEGMVNPYVAEFNGTLVGYAYFDAHRVRTLPETIMVVVDPAGKLQRIEVLSFQEPESYIMKEVWYDLFIGKSLSPTLALRKELPHVTGATLTAQATTDAVRRVLAIHQTLLEAKKLP